ncbi:ATP-binding protein [Pseudanabaena sp. 'Roaring Creek']|uniref:ATP-binding protein n=1 Tax=Pseudanabaena sp. 'Roaring Creek' TaxID=1681830 RepID=UPI0006D7ECB1|nr:ATP-binding protein [Pseudanabaena sp. 'Roaring Creek']
MYTKPTSKVVKERREYNTWVANETLEDYSLRYAPRSFRKWSEFLVANTALGGTSFLALEAIGGSLLLSYGFANSFWAILVVGGIIFLSGIPIAYYAAKYNIDIDLLTRGAGFGYIGSTITSLIYASFTFIFFALEAAIMAQALQLYFHLPLALGYILCSVIIIPIVFYGITLINQLQLWTQPIWLGLMITPFLFIINKEPDAISNWVNFAGNSPSGAAFHPILFGAAATVSFSLIAQIGEQVDYLRFLPEKQEHNRVQWWLAVILAGPGWIVLGTAKQLGGAFLASLAINHGITATHAKEPIQMYLTGFADVFTDPRVVLSVATLFVLVSQIKINVTNAYAGSLAWSNFFSRLTHSHPGRVVWLIFNVSISLMLMEFGVFETLDIVLGLYSNVAIAWIGAVVADLVINKPLGISPSYIEFKRAYLYNFNPVGFGSMVIASIISIVAFVGCLGAYAQAYAPFLAMGIAFVLSPIIAIATKGKYYIARQNVYRSQKIDPRTLISCSICEQNYEPADTAYCPVYDGAICSLCCSLDARCHDGCKTNDDDIGSLTLAIARTVFSKKFSPQLGVRLVRFTGIFLLLLGIAAVVFGLVYYHSILKSPTFPINSSADFLGVLLELYAPLSVLIGMGTWLLVLSEESRELAEAELDRQNLQLQQEIEERQRVEEAMQLLTSELEHRVEDRTKELSEAIGSLKQTQVQLIQTEKMSSLGQLVAGVAHEINNPVNFIYGNLVHVGTYTQDLLNLIGLYRKYYPHPEPEIHQEEEAIDLEFLMEDLPNILSSLKVGAERIQKIVISLRNFSRMDEANLKPVNIHDGIDSTLMILQSRLKARPDRPAINVIKEYGDLPEVECYAGQLNQVFMNILSNAIDAIEEKLLDLSPMEVSQSVSTIKIQTEIDRNCYAKITIADNAKGIPPEVQKRLFDPFFTTKPVGKGTGMGLSISFQVVKEIHNGILQCNSEMGKGTEFIIEIPIDQKAVKA